MPSKLPDRPDAAGFAGDATVWATWLYYAEGRTQAEVAATLGVSRASVANYLAEARRRGLVRVSLAPDLLTQVARGQALMARYGLQGAHIAPGVEDEPDLGARLGIAGARVLSPRLGDATTLGVAWGRTMAELAAALPAQALPGMRVVQVSGSSLGDAASSPEACTIQIAARLGARCRNFHAPAVVSSRALRDALLAEPALIRHFERVRACDTVVFGVGALTAQTRWADGDILIRPAAEAYMAGGGVGVLIGRFIDRQGHEVHGPLGGRQIGMELDDLRRVPARICIAGGVEKVTAIRAMLKGGYATHLVTDASTAERLLEDEE